MAEILNIQVNVTGNGKKDLLEIQSLVDSLNNKKVSIDVEASGAEALKKQAESVKSATEKIGSAGVKASGEVKRAATEIAEGFQKVKESVTEVDKKWTQTATTFKNAAGDEIKQVEKLNGKLDEMGDALTSVSETTTKKFTQALTEEEKAMHTATVQAGLLTDAQGELIDQQEVWRDGQLIKAVNTYRDSVGNVTKVTSELNGNMAKVTTTTRENSEAMKKQADAAELASKRNTLLGDSLDRIVAKIIAWQVINASVAAVIRSFTEAIKTLKEVDSALVTVQKTTDFTQEQIKDLTNETYALASAYGRTADELMNLNADFARAGFKENLTQMTELAALLENVGDIEGETASKFLLAANAAWQLNGEYSSLMEIIDGMNAVTNEAAVDMEALTTGITVAASAFASAGESAQTFTALVGTGVATTQRSGSEIARALRTVLMNVRQIKGELEDGEIIDEESISNAAKALNSIGVSVSENGELRKFSDILDELAGKWDTLTSAEQSYVAESLANKRQANVLLSILQNYGEYERQLEIYANGAGSALKENEIYLDSWEAKTKKLSAAWTEFISHLVNTDLVKGGLDVLTGAIKILDNELTQAVVTAGALVAAIIAIGKALSAINAATGISLLFKDIAGGAMTAGMAVKQLWALFTASPIAVISAIAVALYGVYKIVDALNVSYKEQVEIVEKLNNEYDKNFGAGSEYDALSRKVENLTQKEKDRLKILEAQRIAAEAQLRAEERLAAQKWLEENDTTKTWNRDIRGFVNTSASTENLNQLKDAIAEINALYEQGEPRVNDYNAALAELVNKNKEHYEGLVKARDFGIELNEQQYEFIRLYEEEAQKLAATVVEEENAARASGELAEAQEKVYETADALENQCNAVSKALNDYKNYSNLTTDSINDLKDAIPGLVDALYDEEGKLTDVGREALETANSLDTNRAAVEYLQAVVNSLDVSNTINQINSLREAALTSATAAIALNNALASLGVADYRAGQAMVARGQVKNLDDFLAQAAGSASSLPSTIAAAHTKPTSTSSSRSSSGGSSGSTKDEELEKWKAALTYAKNYYSFLENKGATDEELVEQARNVQAALHDVAEYLRSIGTAEEEIIQYSSEWWQWQSKIDKAAEQAAKAAEEEAKAITQIYQNNVTINQKQLQIVQAIGMGTEAELEATKKLAISYSELLQRQMETNASQDEIYSTALNLINAKKSELSLQQSITKELETQAEKQKELDEKYLSDTVQLRKTDVELAKKLGFSTEEILSYMRRYADAIANQGRWMEQNGAAQADINSLALTYLDVLQEIYDLEKGEETTSGQDKHLDFLKSVVSLRNSELSLMESMDLSTDEQIRKYKEILEALEKQGDYQKEINAEQEEQNETATNYYNTLQKILSLQKERLDEITDAAIAYIDEQEELAKGPLQEQLDLLKEQHDAAKAQREEDEKLLSIEKARIALENAQKQRTVRTYNASSGQWEWVANQKNVESAQEALLKAQEELAEYQYQLQIDALQSEIDKIEKSFDALRAAIKEAAKGIAEGKYTFEQAYSYISTQMKSIYDKYGIDLTGVMKTATADFKSVADEIGITYEQIKTTALSFGAIDSVITEKAEEIGKSLNTLELLFGALGTSLNDADYQLKEATDNLSDTADLLSLLPDEVRKLISGIGSGTDTNPKVIPASTTDTQSVIDRMRANSIAWHNDPENREYYEQENQRLGASIGAVYRNGAWYSSDGNLLYDIRGEVGNNPTVSNTSQVREDTLPSGGATITTVTRIEPDSSPTTQQTSSNNSNEEPDWIRMLGFDSGGVLKGLGGIKATREDELILPPDITKAILKPGLTNEVAERLNELGILTGARGVSTLKMNGGNSIGTQHNGDVYQLGGITLSQEQADVMTVSQLVGYASEFARELDLR